MNPSARTLLLIEDDAVDALAFRRALERSGRPWRLEHAADAAAALDLLRRRGAGGGWLAVLDLNLPGMDGSALLRRLRQEHPGLPVAVLSSSRDVRDVRAAYAAHAAGYFVKTDSSDALAALVAALGAYWELALPPPD